MQETLSVKRNASDEFYLGNYVDDPQIILLPQRDIFHFIFLYLFIFGLVAEFLYGRLNCLTNVHFNFSYYAEDCTNTYERMPC